MQWFVWNSIFVLFYESTAIAHSETRPEPLLLLCLCFIKYVLSSLG